MREEWSLCSAASALLSLISLSQSGISILTANWWMVGRFGASVREKLIFLSLIHVSCASGDCLTSRSKGCSQPRELWFSIYSCILPSMFLFLLLEVMQFMFNEPDVTSGVHSCAILGYFCTAVNGKCGLL